jgi:hypothetical protein
LGKGSQRYLSSIFKCDRKTITKGLLELTMLDTEIDYTRQRSIGGGRKKKNSQLKN